MVPGVRINEVLLYYSLHILIVLLAPLDTCLLCFLIPISAFVLISLLIVVVLIALLYYFLWDAREKRLTPPSIEVSPEKEELKAKGSLVLVHQELGSPPLPVPLVADTIV